MGRALYQWSHHEIIISGCALPVVVVLVDDRNGPRVQVDPEEVGPHFNATLQPVGLLDLSQPVVHRVHAH